MRVARYGAAVRLTDDAFAEMAAARSRVEELAEAAVPAYGISTGFGALATRHIPTALRAKLQRSLVRSHAAGIRSPVETEVVRAMMLLRLRTLATGHTGVRPRSPPSARRAAQRAASRRSCTSTAASAAPATSRRSPTSRSR